MAVTKRTRFEVLRRDAHTCQYCGETAPNVVLQIDHIIPVALGGDDKPSNLVTACKDCNSGKTSIPPDSPLVAGLSERAAAYALGMIDKMTRFRADLESLEEYEEEFVTYWETWHIVGKPDSKIPLPPDYKLSLWRWAQMGVPFAAFELAVPKAMAKRGLQGEYGVFQYMAGIIARMINEREIDYTVTTETAAVYTETEMDNIRADAYSTGHDRGWSSFFNRQYAHGYLPTQDFVAAHIDNMTSPYINTYRDGGTPPWQENTHKSDSTSGTMTTSAF